MKRARLGCLAALVCLLTRGGQANAQEKPPVTVSWQQALDRALSRNASIVIARQEIERAGGLVQEARAGWLPTLAGNGSYTRLDSPRMNGAVITTPDTLWNGNLALTVPLLSP